jgi:hypothetical protein
MFCKDYQRNELKVGSLYGKSGHTYLNYYKYNNISMRNRVTIDSYINVEKFLENNLDSKTAQ